MPHPFLCGPFYTCYLCTSCIFHFFVVEYYLKEVIQAILNEKKLDLIDDMNDIPNDFCRIRASENILLCPKYYFVYFAYWSLFSTMRWCHFLSISSNDIFIDQYTNNWYLEWHACNINLFAHIIYFSFFAQTSLQLYVNVKKLYCY